ncbi:AraC family transcriptional regulator [Sporolactobacillus kofuensis]|uniref:AraC family transcriptional regulator n=1 Tax=Sporolactobacillus kofuensis TaxID=269672 RepID=A0ABW1WG92_9BACL|nr:AraC family transcriptional regulator [Sporolactobacillus kofuensis]MCO7175359.1 AraC family transcriptional regulator [Sporolactobacillus kofuensis]
MKNETKYSPKRNPDRHAYVDIIKRKTTSGGPIFRENWHEEIQFYYLTQGVGTIRCESDIFELHTGGVALMNSNELHFMESKRDVLTCYIIRIDLASLFNDLPDLRLLKDAELLAQQLIVFHHQLSEDTHIVHGIRNLILEHEEHRPGYELAIKSTVLHLIVLLLRAHIRKIYTKEHFDRRLNSLNQMRTTINYIHDHLHSQITVHNLAHRALMSEAHFCRTFKKLYGKPVVSYINALRVDQAEDLLQTSPYTITEIALKVGFNDANYFSRVYKKQKGITPKQTRQSYVKRS